MPAGAPARLGKVFIYDVAYSPDGAWLTVSTQLADLLDRPGVREHGWEMRLVRLYAPPAGERADRRIYPPVAG